MATNRDIIFTVKVRNQVKQTLTQISKDFRAQVTEIDKATRALGNYQKAYSGISRSTKGLNDQAKALRELAKQSGQINDRKIVGLANSIDKMGKSSNSLGRVATNLQNLNRALGQSRGLQTFSTNLGNANTQAQALLATMQGIAAAAQALGRARVNPIRGGAAAGAGATTPPAGAAPPPAGGATPPQTPPQGPRAPNPIPNPAVIRNYARAAQQAAEETKTLREEFTQAAAAVAFVDGPLGGFASRLTAVGTLMDGLGDRVGTLVLGLSTLFVASVAAVRASADLEEQQKRLQAALNSTSNQVSLTVDNIEELISKLAGQSLLDDNEIRQAGIQLLTFRNISNEVFKDALTAATDLAAKGVVDVAQATERLGRALEDPANSLDQLQRSGVRFTVTEQLMIESMIKNGKTLEAQRFIIERVNRSFQGLAKEGASGLYGALNQLRVAVGNFFENLGQQSGLLENVTSLVRNLAEAVQFLADNMKTIVPIFQAFSALLVSVAAQKTLPVVFRATAAVIGSLVSPIGAVSGGFSRLATAQKIAAANGKSTLSVFKSLGSVVGGNFNTPLAAAAASSFSFAGALKSLFSLSTLRTVFTSIGTGIVLFVKNLGGIVPVTRAVITSLNLLRVALLANPFTAIAVALVSLVGAIVLFKDRTISAFGSTFKVIDAVKVVWEDLYGVVSTVVKDVVALMSEFGSAGLTFIKDKIGSIPESWLNAWRAVVQGTKTLLNFLIGLVAGSVLSVIELVKVMYDAVVTTFSNIGQALYEFAQNPMDAGRIFGDLWAKGFTNGMDHGLERIPEIMKKYTTKDFIGDMVSTVTDYATSVVQRAEQIGLDDQAFAEEEARLQRMVQHQKEMREQTEAQLKSMKDFLKNLDSEIEGMRIRNNLSNEFGRTLERDTKLAQIALDAFNSSLLNTPENIEMIKKKMQEYLAEWERADALQRGQVGMWRGMRSAVEEFVDSSTNTFQNFHDFTASAIDSLADRWVEFTQTGKLDWKGMLNEMAAEMQRFAFKYALATIVKQVMPQGGDDPISKAFGIARDSTTSSDATALINASKSDPMRVAVVSVVPTADTPGGGNIFTNIFDNLKNLFSGGSTDVAPSQADAARVTEAVTVAATTAATAAVQRVAIGAPGSGSPGGASIGSFTPQNVAPVSETIATDLTTSVQEALRNSAADWRDFLSAGLAERGFNRQQIAGVFGGLNAESRLNPTAVGPGGDFGIAQWLGSRLTDLKAYAAEMGGSFKDAKIQAGFLLKEIDSTEKAAANAVKATTNAADAAEVWIRRFERPAAEALGADIQRARSGAPGFVPKINPALDQTSSLPAGFQIVPTSAEVDPALAKQIQEQFAAQVQQQYESLSKVLGQGGPRDLQNMGLEEISRMQQNATAAIENSLSTVSATVNDAATKTTTVFKAIPDSFSQFPPLVQEASAQINETFKGIPEQLSPASLGISDIQMQIKDSLASVGQSFTAEQLKVVPSPETQALIAGSVPPTPSYDPLTSIQVPQAPVGMDFSAMQTSMNDALVTFTEQFAGDTQQMLAPLQQSVQTVASTVQQSGDQLSSSIQYTTAAFPQLAAGAQQAGTSMQSAGAAASTASTGVSTLGTSASTAAPPVQSLGTNAQAAGQSLQSAGGTGAGGLGGLFSSILGSVGGMIKGIAGQIFGIAKSLFGSLMQMLGGLGGGGGLGGLLGGLFHTGGEIGKTIPQSVQLVSKAAAMSAPRYHTGTGLRADERLAILQTGELVISRPEAEKLRGAQVQRLSSSDAVPDWDRRTERGSYANAMNMGREQGRQVVVKQYITTPDPAAFNASQGQLARQTFSAMDRMNRRNS